MKLAPSRGTHLVFERERLPLKSGMTLRVPGRVVFVIPYPGTWIVGTTDVGEEGALAEGLGQSLGLQHGAARRAHGTQVEAERPPLGHRPLLAVDLRQLLATRLGLLGLLTLDVLADEGLGLPDVVLLDYSMPGEDGLYSISLRISCHEEE